MRSRGRRFARAAAAVLVAAFAVSACGGGGDARPVVDWYVADDALAWQSLADTCADGEFAVRVHELPADPDTAHTELIRRLGADGASVDLLTVDASLIAELASAKYVKPLTTEQATTASTGAVPAAVEQVTFDDRMYAVPWLFDPQVLWYRAVVAERAGLDVTKPIVWDDLIGGADRLGVTVQVADPHGTGLAAWISGLVAAGAGDVIDDLSGNAGRGAASVVEFYRESQVGPGPTPEAAASFAGSKGGFLLAPGYTASDPALGPLVNEVRVTQYPVITGQSVPPASGLALAVSADSTQTKRAQSLIDCLASDETLKPLITTTGHAPARTALLADPEVVRDLPIAPQLAKAQATARPVPVTPSWNAIRRAIDDTWAPLTSVTTDDTPTTSQAAVTAALRGELP